MPRTCTVCRHEKREAIDTAMVAGEALRTIADRWSVSKTALIRHRDHIPHTLAKAHDAAEAAHADNLVDRLEALNRETQKILHEARAEGRKGRSVALLAIARAEKQIDLQARFLGELRDGDTVNVLVASPEWADLRARILAALAPFPKAWGGRAGGRHGQTSTVERTEFFTRSTACATGPRKSLRGSSGGPHAEWTMNALARSLAEALESKPWAAIARPAQLPPAGKWRFWLLLGGRGAGKGRASAEWVTAEVMAGRARHVAIVGRTAADVRDVMVEGPQAGLLAIAREWFRPTYEPSKRRLTWPNGAVATTYSADEPDLLRGPQHDLAWCDEWCAWDRVEDTWSNLKLGLRIGANPRCVISTQDGTPGAVEPAKAGLAAMALAVGSVGQDVRVWGGQSGEVVLDPQESATWRPGQPKPSWVW